ncbi:MAG: hypothetical protein HYX39_12240 [Bacteroidetes bacterium]|nr:hypothetical protein [Bacteroidota bacterium]
MKTTNNKNGLQNLVQRIKSETPPFFKKIRTGGLILVAAGGVLVASPIALPAMAVTVGGYLIVAGTVATAISQAAVEGGQDRVKKKQ